MVSHPFDFPVAAVERALNGGVQYEFSFLNGYGASVIRSPYSYGFDAGLWELAVLGKDGEIAYDTPITADVLGHLDPEAVAAALQAVRALP